MKYFVVSDIHSFYSELRLSLKEAGYNKNNKDHTLIVVGDIFDRGSEAVSLYKFLKSIPKSRKILIKGNHELLYFELLEKEFPDSYDFSNGTVDTFCQIAGYKEEVLNQYYWTSVAIKEGLDDWGSYYNKPYEYWAEIVERVKNHEITKWLNSKE